jgi:hypothetical protein
MAMDSLSRAEQRRALSAQAEARYLDSLMSGDDDET